MRIILASAALAVGLSGLVTNPATGHEAEWGGMQYPTGVRPCHYEDGSGQRLCVWDHRHAGNGYGDLSILIRRGGTDRAVYTEITHRRAHRLIHRFRRFH